MSKIKLIFTGTAEIGAPLLGELAKDNRFEVTLVVTQKDKPAGRKMELQPSPIKKTAETMGLSVFQPEDINAVESLERLKATGADLILVFAYGQLLKKELLSLPVYGCVNVHASLLPKYRGATPIQSALLSGETETGISVMKMAEALDAGPVFERFKIPISPKDNSVTLHDRLARLAAQKTPDVLAQITDGLKAEPQNETGATFCQKLQKSDGQIDWNEEASEILSKVKAFAGWPTTFTYWNGKRLKILEAEAGPGTAELPGQAFEMGGTLLISAKTGSIKPTLLQLEGKSPQPSNEFIKGYPNLINSKLGAQA